MISFAVQIENMENSRKVKLGITIGDINGISPEIILKAFESTMTKGLFIPIIYGSAKHIVKVNQLLDRKEFKYQRIKNPDEATDNQVYILDCLNEDYFELEVGVPTKKAGKLAFDALERATHDLKKGEIDGIVTCPINKDTIQQKDFNFPGHTEYFTSQFDAKESLMFMVSEKLRVGVVTGHMPLEKVKESITKELIAKKLDLMLGSLRSDFGIYKPKIAVLGLNPHAGENGLLGEDEEKTITPVIDRYKQKGELVFGPFPADGFFASSSYQHYDAVLAMYHDQGLAPFKIIAFGEGINFTAGLKIVRTSPDHGTAYDIAGKDIANPSSLLNAIFLALDVINQRLENEFNTSNQIDKDLIRKKIGNKFSK
jgi:4-hydroxythreonine-4-phosphate dehydrogenase